MDWGRFWFKVTTRIDDLRYLRYEVWYTFQLFLSALCKEKRGVLFGSPVYYHLLTQDVHGGHVGVYTWRNEVLTFQEEDVHEVVFKAIREQISFEEAEQRYMEKFGHV